MLWRDVGGWGGNSWRHPASDASRAVGGNTPPEEVLQRAVDAARHAGAVYADARVTQIVSHAYNFRYLSIGDSENVAFGIRALVDGYWGFVACPSVGVAAAERMAREAVAQAKVNARGAVARAVDLGQIPIAQGSWSTPIAIDPFAVPIEEKEAYIRYWKRCANKVGLAIDPIGSHLTFTKQIRSVVTSEGAHFTQAMFESGGVINIMPSAIHVNLNLRLPIQSIDVAGEGWERLLNADIPGQLQKMPEQFIALDAVRKEVKPAMVGRYMVVCDGATMAALTSATLGAATQLDRALGYEANAKGTSFLNDPLKMLGTFVVGSPHVTLTANRSAPTQLATIKWDDEGVLPPEITLIKEGVLNDFQTTREQSAWLAPYYAKAGRPVRSNGCAASESALRITMQQTPNLSLEPGSASVRIDDLIANVGNGILLEGMEVRQLDFQARNGLLVGGQMREIKNGRLGRLLTTGVIQFNTMDLWKNIIAIGGPSTRMTVPFSQYPWGGEFGQFLSLPVKGEPAQLTSHSVQAVAATIANQAVINPRRKA